LVAYLPLAVCDSVSTAFLKVGTHLDVRARILLDAELLERRLLGAEEAERQQDEVGLEELLGARDLRHAPIARQVLLPVDADGVDATNPAVAI